MLYVPHAGSSARELELSIPHVCRGAEARLARLSTVIVCRLLDLMVASAAARKPVFWPGPADLFQSALSIFASENEPGSITCAIFRSYSKKGTVAFRTRLFKA